WISSHSDVEGNEEADRQAKDAAAGNTSPPQDLPPILRKPIARSIAAEKQAFHQELKKTWQERWSNSPRKHKFDQIDPDFPFTKHRRIAEKLNRTQSSLLIQI
ncbi:hypothetical protein B0H34DRAFT_617689, partial [Crassisporium funariophilum]